MNRRSSRAGFSLLESTVAVAILALILPVLLKGLEGGIFAMARAETAASRWRLANDLITEAAATTDGRPGRREGREGDLVWSIETTEGGEGEETREGEGRPRLSHLHVAVGSTEGRQGGEVVTLDTLVFVEHP